MNWILRRGHCYPSSSWSHTISICSEKKLTNCGNNSIFSFQIFLYNSKKFVIFQRWWLTRWKLSSLEHPLRMDFQLIFWQMTWTVNGFLANMNFWSQGEFQYRGSFASSGKKFLKVVGNSEGKYPACGTWSKGERKGEKAQLGGSHPSQSWEEWCCTGNSQP